MAEAGSPADAAALDFRDIDAIGDRTAYALSIGNGPASRIYKTIDAGATWTLQFTNTDEKAFFDAMAFWDAERGVAFSDSVDSRFIVLTTGTAAAGGRASIRTAPARARRRRRLRGERHQCRGHRDRHVWIATSGGRVLRSTDGGRSWMVSATPLATGASAGPFSIAFRDPSHGRGGRRRLS